MSTKAWWMPVLMGFISPVAAAVCRLDNINDCDNCTTVAASCEEGLKNFSFVAGWCGGSDGNVTCNEHKRRKLKTFFKIAFELFLTSIYLSNCYFISWN
ncbi:MAG: hypothetical protein QMB11_01340 [Nonlabens sp.]|uniref:hypothetical protein n=1 Tax=Nonlabens sp. TaxID=1888209 RepID=UPI0035A631E3